MKKKIQLSRAINIRKIKLTELKPHGQNPRKHPKNRTLAWQNLAKSLSDQYFDPVIFNLTNRKLVSGHLRVKILRDLGYTHASVVVVKLSESEHLARLLASNKLSGRDNRAALVELVGELADKVEGELMGLTEIEIKKLIGETEIQKPDLVDEAWAYRVVVDCESEADQIKLARRFDKEGRDFDLYTV